jgi:hypothetical protein
MSKIVRAINAMVSNPDKIKAVTPGVENDEVFFSYMEKHKWSLVHENREDRYLLHFYPADIPLERLARIPPGEWESIPMVSYSSDELSGREAIASMRDLYMIVREKAYGVDEVLDEIIADANDIEF